MYYYLLLDVKKFNAWDPYWGLHFTLTTNGIRANGRKSYKEIFNRKGVMYRSLQGRDMFLSLENKKTKDLIMPIAGVETYLKKVLPRGGALYYQDFKRYISSQRYFLIHNSYDMPVLSNSFRGGMEHIVPLKGAAKFYNTAQRFQFRDKSFLKKVLTNHKYIETEKGTVTHPFKILTSIPPYWGESSEHLNPLKR